MNSKFWYPLLSCMLLLFNYGFGQELENLPPSIKWQQIQSTNFRVIFPQGYEQEAIRTTNILERIHQPASKSLGASPRRFPIILQTHYSVANGFVNVAPYRSEFFMFSPQDYNSIGNDLWLEHLASHEYRHMVQFEKALTPFNKLMYVFMGEFAPAVFAGMAAPSWFWEGDAVGIETAMGHTGRGRTPKFTMAFRANTIDKGGFKYNKQHLTSFRDFVPNHYLTGYLMTTDLKTKYGADVWDKIVGRSFKAPFLPFAFSNSIKKVTGNYLRKSYDQMMAEQTRLIQDQLSQFEPSTFDRLNDQSRNTYTNYLHPQLLSNGNIICLKEGWSDIEQLVMIDSQGNESKLKELGFFNDPGYLSANDSLVVWTEYEFDIRWRRKSYSVIKKYNFLTDQFTILTNETRYAAVSVSPRGQFVGISQSVNGTNRIDLFNNQGLVVKWFDNPDNHFYSMPDFVNEEQIVLLKHFDGGKGIITKDLATGEEKLLIFSKEENFGRPIIKDGILYYNTAKDGIDNLFALDLTSKLKYQVTKSRFGAFNTSISGNQLVYNDYTADGMDVVGTTLEKKSWVAIEDDVNPSGQFYQTMVTNEAIEDVLYKPDSTSYQITKYPKAARMFRPTSWGLTFLPEDNLSGAYLFSKDLLSTTSMRFGTEYDYNQRIWRHSGLISYQAWFPIFDFEVEIGERAGSVANIVDEDIAFSRDIWKENTFTIGMRFPFVLTNSNFLRRFDIDFSTDITKVSDYGGIRYNLASLSNGNLNTFNFRTSYYRVRKRTRLDLAPKWGQSISFHSKTTPFGGDYNAGLFATEANLYFPGLFKHHSIRLIGGYLTQDVNRRDTTNYIMSSPIRYLRGYDYRVFDQFVNFSINYKLPILYTDLHLGPIINLQRIYANGFYDRADGTFEGHGILEHSIGAEIHANFNVMRFLALLDVGFRYAHRLTDQGYRYEILIGAITF